ncbi:MAG: DUF3422 family protein, partial [Paracoccus sp. (in: a-proteobacteria)]|nr:DUF3422 family protein [Paracoccus sp. (in: a-proteobacteria)]
AISYYAVGLLGHALEPVAGMVGLEKAYLVAALTPVTVLVVWLAMGRVRRRLHHDDSSDS